MSRLLAIRFFVVLFVLISINATHGQDPDGQSPNRGFQPNGAYAVSDIESISLAGGNMVYSLPLASLPAGRGGRLKPVVHLRYNSKLFNTQVRMCLGPNCTFKYVQTDLIPSTFGGWTYGTHYFVLTTNRATNYVDTAPSPWNQYKFKTEIFFPDGSSHQLRPSNQAETDEYYTVSPGSTGTTRTYYTTDGSYLRVEFSTDGASWTIYFPDGSTVNFNNSTGVQTTTDGNGNFYTTQNVTLPNGNPATVVADQLNRKITIEKPVSGPHYVRVKGFGGPELVTTINWGTTNPQGKKWLWKEFVEEGIYHYKTSVSVRPIITSINLPNGLSYQFEYNSNVFDPLNPTKSVGWGELYRTTLPTGAVVQYAYSMDNRHGNETDDIIEPKHIMWDHPTSKQLSYTESYDGVNTPRTETWTYAVNIIEGGPAEGQTQSASATSPDGGVNAEHFFANLTGQTDFGKDGLTYKSIGPDGSRVERHWQENTPYNGSGSTKNSYVKTEFVSIPDAGGTLVKTAIKDYVYDKNGNVTQVAEYDWVPYGDVARDADGKPTGVIPASAQLKKVTASGFYNQTPTADSNAHHAAIYNLSTAPNLRNAAQWSEVRSGFAASSALSRVEFDYDDPNTKGNLTTTRMWDSSKGPRTDSLNASNSVSTSAQYNSYGSPVLTIDARLTKTEIIYDAVDGFIDLYPTKVKTAYQTAIQLTQTREYDLNTGVVTKVTDDDNNVSTSTVYDVFGRPTLVKAAEGKPEETWIRTEYSDTLRRIIVKSDLNVLDDGKLVSIQHYDQLGRLRLSRQLEDSATESATDETTGVKVQTRYLYSGANSFQLVSNAYRAATSGAAGSEQTMGWTRSKLDVAGRVLEVQTFGGATLPSPWGTNSSSTGTVSTTYHTNFTTVADQAGKLRRSMVDGLGRLVRVDEPDASNNLGSFTSPIQPTAYGYDASGSLVSVNQGAQNRYFMYDSLKRLIRARNPEQGTHSNLNLTDPITGNSAWSIAYEYDPNGNLTEKTDARNVVSTYEYDALNRNTEIDHSDTSVDPDVSRFYDGATTGKGRLWYSLAGGNDLVGSDVEKTLFSSYDALGRPLVLQQRFKLNNAWVSQTYQVTRVYNLAGGVTSQTYPSGNSVTYNYDNAGRLADKDAQNLAFTGNLGGVSRTYSRGISYASGGQLKQEQFGTTTTPVYNKLFYNSRQQLAEILASTTGSNDSWNRGKILNQYSLQCSGAGCNASDNNGNLRKQEVFIPADDQVSSSTSWYQQYDYDELNRLKRVHEYTGTPSLDWQQEFNYDRWGNRTLSATNTWVGNQNNPPNPLLNEMQCDTGALASTNRLYAPGDLALAENQRRMIYDPAGNLTNDTYTGAGERFYDAENRMTKAWGGTNQWQYYTYNADGQRTRRKIDNQETWQIYGFEGELLAEYAANAAVDQPQKEYGYRNGQLLVTAEAATAVATNVALASNGATATASSTWSNPPFSYLPISVNNGDHRGLPAGSNSNWASNGASLPQWVEVAFNGSKTINQINVFSLQDNYHSPVEPTEATTFSLYGLTAFEVQYWNGSAWVTVPGGSVSGNNKVWKKITFAPISTTKIKVFITATSDSWSRMVEVEAWTPGVQPNVALASSGAIASASSTWSNPPLSYLPSSVTDGDHRGLNAGNNSQWASNGASLPQWVEVAFNGSKTINQIDVFSLQDNYHNPIEPTEATTFSLYGLTAFEVQYWNGSAWVTVPGGSVSGNNKVWKKITFAPLTTTKIRVLISGTSDGWSRMVELRAWSPSSANINWLITDHLGTPRMIIDQTGSLANVRRHDYLPFGEELIGLGSRSTTLGYSVGDGVRQQFTQQERDNETGLDYFGARYYAAPQGRFTSPDEFWKDSQIGDPQSWNKYAYVRNNPLRYVDPTGEKATVKVQTDEDKKTGTITITASIAIYSQGSSNLSQEQLSQAQSAIESSIEGAWSGTFEQDGITYTVTTDVNVQVYGSQGDATNSGAQNVIGISSGDSQPGRAVSHVNERPLLSRDSAPDTGVWRFSRVVVGRQAAHEFTHLLGAPNSGRSANDVSYNNPFVPAPSAYGNATANDYRHTLGGALGDHREGSRRAISPPCCPYPGVRAPSILGQRQSRTTSRVLRTPYFF